MRITYILEDMLFSNFLVSSSRATYVRLTRVQKIMTKKQHVFTVLVTLSKDATVAKTIGITHIDDPTR